MTKKVLPLSLSGEHGRREEGEEGGGEREWGGGEGERDLSLSLLNWKCLGNNRLWTVLKNYFLFNYSNNDILGSPPRRSWV